MRKIRNGLILFLVLISGLTAFLATKAWTRLPFRQLIDCSEIGISNLDASSGEVTCESRQYFFGQYYSILLKKNPGPNASVFLLRGYRDKYSLAGQALQAPPGKLYVADMTGQLVWISSGTGTDWSSATRALVALPKETDQIILSLPNGTEYNLIMTSNFRKELHSNFFNLLTAFFAMPCMTTSDQPNKDVFIVQSPIC